MKGGVYTAGSISIYSHAASIETNPCPGPMPPCCREAYRVTAGFTRGCCCFSTDEVGDGAAGAVTGSDDARVTGASCRCGVDGTGGGDSDDAPDPGVSCR